MKALSILFLLPLLFSCSKYVEQQQDDLLVQLITNGKWKVVTFTKDSTDVSASFSGYEFQFKNDKTVDAIKNTVVEKTGTWETNLASQTITTNYNVSTEPLSLLNGIWKITNSSFTFVEASMTVNGVEKRLRLEKAM